jgi:glycosyltransferase involved in cell wall biosynthesis
MKRINKDIKVSIITSVFNGEEYLENTIRSVLNQSYSNIEYIVIDGGSTDGTLDIIKQYERRISYWESARDKGVYDGMNRGISLATGELIGLINSDDFYFPITVETIVKNHIDFDADLYHGNYMVYRDYKTYFYYRKFKRRIQNPVKSDIIEDIIFHPTCFIKKDVYDTLGLYNTKYSIASDLDFFYRLMENNCIFHYIDQCLVGFRSGGLSSKLSANIEAYKIMKEHMAPGIYKPLVTYFRSAFFLPFQSIINWKKKKEHFL